MITNLIGKPDAYLLNQIEDSDNRTFMEQLPDKKGKNFAEVFKGQSKECIDLLQSMLTFDPEKRITIEEALAHKYLERLHMPEDEPTGDPVPDFDFDFEMYSLRINELKELIFEEI